MGTHYPGTAHERLALDVYIKLTRAAESVGQRINAHLKDAQLTVSQFGVLEALYHLGSLCQSDLAHKILKSSGNMTLVIDNLERRGLVERQRDSSDRRYVTVSLTAAGHDLISSLFPKHVAIVVSEIGVLTPEEQTHLAALCRKLGLGVEATEAARVIANRKSQIANRKSQITNRKSQIANHKPYGKDADDAAH